MGYYCKGCGAGSTKEAAFVAWNCGSIINESGFARSDACYEAELRTLWELLEEVKEKLDMWLYHADNGLLSCAKTLARETKQLKARIQKAMGKE